MASNKKSARAKQRAAFEASFSDMPDIFERESQRREEAQRLRQEHLIYKSCESKNRYASHEEAARARRDCEAYGTFGLNIYRCGNCNGWHLTSKSYERD